MGLGDYTVRSKAWVMLTFLWTERRTDTTENLIFPQLRWRKVNMNSLNIIMLNFALTDAGYNNNFFGNYN